ncbi:hypothetical protein ACF8FF_06860 [Pseudomonas sp. zjy_13]|uniref:hypothetical protein n=1 Tax=Pseudomonas sp. zjy_13 TaxID=3367263 RepID=UPI00370C9DD7
MTASNSNERVLSPLLSLIISVMVSATVCLLLILKLPPEPSKIAVLNLRVGQSPAQAEELISRARELALEGYVVMNATELVSWPPELELIAGPDDQEAK